jgi:hypothetical protein
MEEKQVEQHLPINRIDTMLSINYFQRILLCVKHDGSLTMNNEAPFDTMILLYQNWQRTAFYHVADSDIPLLRLYLKGRKYMSRQDGTTNSDKIVIQLTC